MDKVKQYAIFTVLGCLVVLAAGWLLVISPKRSEAAALTTQAAAQAGDNVQLAGQLQILKAQAKDLPRQQAKLAAVAARIPDNPALPSLIRALSQASTSAGIELTSLSPGLPAAAAASVAVVPGRPATAAAAPTAGLLSIPVSLNVSGGYFQIEQFLANLENLQRSMRVSGFSLSPGGSLLKPTAAGPADNSRILTTTISGTVFMSSNRPAAAAAVVAPAARPGAVAAGAARSATSTPPKETP